MNKSQRLRLRDLRIIYYLLAECRELGRDPLAWQLHLLEGVRGLVGAQVAMVGALGGFGTPKPRTLRMLDLGWAGDRERECYLDFGTRHEADAIPEYQPLCGLPRRTLLTRTRSQLLPDTEWYRGEHFNRWRRPARIDSVLLSIAPPTGAVGEAQATATPLLALYRALGDRDFEKRERLRAHWLHHELLPLLGTKLATGDEPPPPKLSPRQQQVLACLLRGDSEKQAARELGLSPQTVHDYVKALYRRVGVHSRGELLAWWIGRFH